MNDNNHQTPGRAFAAIRDVEQLEDQVDRLSKIVDRALERMEAIVVKLNDGNTKFALMEAEINRLRERAKDSEEKIKELEDTGVTREYFRETLSAELRPIITEQVKADDERVWLRRIVIGAVVVALLGSLGLGFVS